MPQKMRRQQNTVRAWSIRRHDYRTVEVQPIRPWPAQPAAYSSATFLPWSILARGTNKRSSRNLFPTRTPIKLKRPPTPQQAWRTTHTHLRQYRQRQRRHQQTTITAQATTTNDNERQQIKAKPRRTNDGTTMKNERRTNERMNECERMRANPNSAVEASDDDCVW